MVTTEELNKQVTELQNQLAKATLRSNAFNSVGRPAVLNITFLKEVDRA